ncbi:hypothetical protein CapIbe_016091 [Capra ibex]
MPVKIAIEIAVLHNGQASMIRRHGDSGSRDHRSTQRARSPISGPGSFAQQTPPAAAAGPPEGQRAKGSDKETQRVSVTGPCGLNSPLEAKNPGLRDRTPWSQGPAPTQSGGPPRGITGSSGRIGGIKGRGGTACRFPNHPELRGRADRAPKLENGAPSSALHPLVSAVLWEESPMAAACV